MATTVGTIKCCKQTSFQESLGLDRLFPVQALSLKSHERKGGQESIVQSTRRAVGAIDC